MKILSNWQQLEAYGIEALTGEACGVSWRIPCDVTAQGKHVLEKCFGIPSMTLAESWNRGNDSDPHVGSIMLTPDMLIPLGVFALLESGCKEVWLYKSGGLLGIEPNDPSEEVGVWRSEHNPVARTFAYKGTAGDRNVHVMTGRIT